MTEVRPQSSLVHFPQYHADWFKADTKMLKSLQVSLFYILKMIPPQLLYSNNSNYMLGVSNTMHTHEYTMAIYKKKVILRNSDRVNIHLYEWWFSDEWCSKYFSL